MPVTAPKPNCDSPESQPLHALMLAQPAEEDVEHLLCRLGEHEGMERLAFLGVAIHFRRGRGEGRLPEEESSGQLPQLKGVGGGANAGIGQG